MEQRHPEAVGRGREWVTIAVLGKPRGTRGELFALPTTSHMERFAPGREFTLWFDGESGRAPLRMRLELAWNHNEKLILKLAGVDSMEEAGQLRGAELCLRAEEREPLPEGEFYYDDLKGLAVVDLATGERLGTVTGFTEGVGPGVLDIETPVEGARGGAEVWQVPFAKEICVEVNLAGGEIRVRLPGGLRELNRTESRSESRPESHSD